MAAWIPPDGVSDRKLGRILPNFAANLGVQKVGVSAPIPLVVLWCACLPWFSGMRLELARFSLDVFSLAYFVFSGIIRSVGVCVCLLAAVFSLRLVS